MEQPLWLQGSRVLLAVLLGLVQGLHYDILRGLRRNLRWLTPLADFWFVVCWLAGNLLFALRFGDGQFRISMLLGSMFGSVVYFSTLSRILLPVFDKIFALISWPLRMAARMGKKFLLFLKNFTKNIFSSVKKSVTIKRPKQKRRTALGGTNDASAQIVTHYKTVDPGADDLRLRHDHDITAADQRAGRGARKALGRGR